MLFSQKEKILTVIMSNVNLGIKFQSPPELKEN